MNSIVKTLDIILVTYNQSKYIQQALCGINIQRVSPDIKVNVIVADDCSADDTLEIIRAAEIRSPFPFKYLQNDKNLGIAGNYERAIAATTGDLIAILEGDDYWTDPYRLQKHLDFFDTHSDCVMTKNDYLEYSQRNREYRKTSGGEQYLFLREMINHYRWANLSATVYRGDVLRNLDKKVFEYGEKQRNEATDWYLTIAVLKEGYGYALNEVMSVYRYDTGENISSHDNRSYDNILCMADLCNKQSVDILGVSYKQECQNIYTTAIEYVEKERKNKRCDILSDYVSPCFAEFLCFVLPKALVVVKHIVRQCIPNKLHKKLKWK